MKMPLSAKVVVQVLSLFFITCSLAIAADQLEGLTKANPIMVDQAKETVSLLAEVNGKYLYAPTRHAVVFEGGGNGNKSVFRALVNVEPFHKALVEIGAKAGENMTFKNKEKTHVQGDVLLVTVTWEEAEREYDLDEVITDSNGKSIVMRFGGNLPAALKKRTDCLLCLDSCPVGIVSNFTYTYGAVEKRGEVSFMGNRNLLPPNGSVVVIKLKKQRLGV